MAAAAEETNSLDVATSGLRSRNRTSTLMQIINTILLDVAFTCQNAVKFCGIAATRALVSLT